jgi:phage tail-like protein
MTAPALGQDVDPYRAYRFKLLIPGLADAHFSSCTGLAARVTPIRYREGGAAQLVQSIPGPVEFADVTLRYGLTASSYLFDWFLDTAKGNIQRQNVSITVLDADGTTERVRWDLIRAWPCEWRGSALDAMSHEVAIETLTLTFESFSRV